MDVQGIAPTPLRIINGLMDTDPGARTIAELGIGLNPGARMTARMLEAEKAFRTAHIAFGSIRMEPVFMVLGQSAAAAAGVALDCGVSVQEVRYGILRERLRADGQIVRLSDRPESQK